MFVFGVTQVVASVHGHLDWPTLWRAAVVLGLLWWAWSQYTWIAGTADFDELRPRLVLLFATAGTFIVAVAVQGAWEDDAQIFAMGYFAVMALAAVFFLLRTMGTDRMEGAVAYLWRMMAGSLLVLVGGFVSDDLRVWFWVGGVVVNLLSAVAAGRYEYAIEASHFAERHGLFIIIVLGEALIAIGVGTVGSEGSTAFFVAGTSMLLIALAMWWSYFDWLFRLCGRALQNATGVAQGRLARDAYTVAHYPMVAGVILFAVGTEELLAHPDAALDDATRWAFVGGLMLFLAAESIMVRRATGSLTWERFGLVGLLGVAGLVLGDVNGAALGVVVFIVLAWALGTETVRQREALGRVR